MVYTLIVRMANEAQKKVIANNRKVLKIWTVIAILVTSFSAFMIFYVKRGDPKKQNKATFYSGLTCAMIGYVFAIRATGVIKRDGKIVARGDFSGRSAHILDVVGVGLIVEFVGIWWDQAAYLFILIPGFIVYTFVKKVLNWLKAF